MDRNPPPCTEDDLPDPPAMDTATVARIANALGHPVRIAIVDQFRACTPYIVQEIVDQTDLAQSTVSEHLRILREAGVVFVTQDGPRHWYCLRRRVLRAFAEAVERLTDESMRLETEQVE